MNPIYKFELNRTTVNLFNPKVVFAEKQIDTGTGELTNALAYDSSDFIAVQPNTNYHFLLNDNTVVPSNNLYVCAYKTNKEFISYISYSTLQFSTPADCGFVRFSFYNENYSGYLPGQIGLFPANVSSWTDYITPIAYPVYKDDLAKDFEKESNQEFFRAKLSGNLSFVGPDYDWIVGRAFDFQFIITVYISYNAGQTWTQYWRGTFWKTDCEFDDDAKTVSVKPTVWDQYNDVLAGLDKEYNLIELAPEIVPVKADKRPMIQVYVPGQSVIGCFLSGMWWEQEANAESDETKLVNDFHFSLNKSLFVVNVSGGGSISLPEMFTGNTFDPTQQGTQEYTNGGYTFRYSYGASSSGSGVSWSIIRNSDSVVLWSKTLTNQFPYSLPYGIALDPVSGSGATGTVTLYLHTINVYSRFVCDTATINDLQTYEIPADDIVENNRNYHRVIGYYFPDTIYFSMRLTSTPNQWGLYQPGQYYQPPYLYWSPELFPVARNAWNQISIWFTFSVFDWIVEESGRQPFTIRHAYPLSSVISVLLAKIAPDITHAGTTDYSQFLYGTNLIGITQNLLITPKSNLVTAGYDQPAQKAPITLKNVLDMLRDCFRCYWFIDEQNRFRVEHIQYFRNGGSYSGSPVVGIDLTTQKVPRNGKEWAFARNQYKFDKPEMAARYQFGWMDDVTQLFEGFPIDIISKYVNPDNIEQIDVSRFTSDIDYILLNPGAISKDGFVLLAAVEQKYGSTNLFVAGNSQPGKYIAPDGTINNGANYLITDFIPINNNGLHITGTGVSFSQNTAFCYYDESQNLIATVISTSEYYDNGRKINNVNNAAFVKLTIGGYSETNVNTWDIREITGGFALPYYNFVVEDNDHYLQNAYVAFCILQQYYAFDMPASQYEINGETMYAYGIKKLKNQTLRFPVLNDPDLVQLVKTNLGNGTIEKLSVNLSSRNANATLKYDTE